MFMNKNYAITTTIFTIIIKAVSKIGCQMYGADLPYQNKQQAHRDVFSPEK